MAEQLWRVPDLAAFLNTTPANVYYLIAAERVPGVVRIGKMIRIDPDVVRQWIDAKRPAGVSS
jgi:predicted DNA-binding transcriptional regulator AlpA